MFANRTVTIIILCWSSFLLADGDVTIYASDNHFRSEEILNLEHRLIDEGDSFNTAIKFVGNNEINNPLLQFYLSMDFIKAGMIPKGIKLLNETAHKGVSASMMKLGEYYFSSNILQEDRTMAFHWFEKAAIEKSEPEAMIKVGLFLHGGIGTAPDPSRAKEFYIKATKFNNSEAFLQLALFCVSQVLGDNTIGKDCKIVDNFEKAIELGHPDAEVKLAMYYLFGLDQKNSKEEGLATIMELAKQGNIEAQQVLGQHYLNGVLLEKDVELAIQWLEKAAVAGDTKSQALLGIALSKKVNSVESMKTAERWLVLAAQSGELEYVNMLVNFYTAYSKINPEYIEKINNLKSSIE